MTTDPLPRRPHHSLVLSLAAMVGLSVIACRSTPATAVPAEPAAAPAAGPMALVAIPRWTNEGPDREVEVLLEEDGLKIAAIALRRGTPLPVHSVGSRISIQVVHGAGELGVDTSSIPVEAGSLVVVEPEIPHSMTPAHEELVVLLVHYLGARPAQ